MQGKLPGSLLAEENIGNPYPLYAAARRDAPVVFIEEQSLWLVSRYDDCEYVLEHPELFSSRESLSSVNAYRNSPEALKILKESRAQPRARTLINADPPDHTIFRSILQRALSPARTLRELTPRIQQVVDELIDNFAERGTCEFVREFAYPLPMRVVAAIFNVPADMISQLKVWSDDFISVQAGNIPAERVPDAARHSIEFERFILAEVDKRKRESQDDFLGRLVNQPPTEKPLTDQELLNICLQVLVGGNESTTNFLGNGIFRILTIPGLKQKMQQNPDKMSELVEEILRYEAPLQGLFRIANRDCSVGGVDIPAGAKLMVCFASANRDEKYYDESFDPERDNRSVIHLAFGRGIHACAGQAFARREGAIAFRQLIERLPDLRVSVKEAPIRNKLFSIIGFKELTLEFSPRPKFRSLKGDTLTAL